MRKNEDNVVEIKGPSFIDTTTKGKEINISPTYKLDLKTGDIIIPSGGYKSDHNSWIYTFGNGDESFGEGSQFWDHDFYASSQIYPRDGAVFSRKKL